MTPDPPVGQSINRVARSLPM